MKTIVDQLQPGLYLVSLPIGITGFEGFVTAWVYTGGPVVVVDVGPSAAAPGLLSALAEIGVHKPDFFLLTHIHIDHAGGIGNLVRTFPDTPVICHPKAAVHLVEPERLWEASLNTLGEVARQYGPIVPVAPARVLDAGALEGSGITVIPTPGHAAHQYSYFVGDLLFAGEAGGVCIAVSDDGCYLRPATPPRFFLETSLDSIDRLLARQPRRICYGHVGMRGDAVEMLRRHRDQLLKWFGIVKKWFDTVSESDTEQNLADIVAHLLEKDALLAGFAQLPPAAQQRELFFLRNSVRGYLGFCRAISP